MWRKGLYQKKVPWTVSPLPAYKFLSSAPWPYINQPTALVTNKAYHMIINIHMNRIT
jgi:hypothetical protein